jgi:hypothetical protein
MSIIVVFAGTLQAQEFPPKPPVIEVQGTAIIKVVPDIMKWSLSIKTDSDNVIDAKNDNDRSVLKVLDLLKDMGVDPKDIQTGGVKISKNYDYLGSKVKKFNVSNDIWFTSNEISRYDEFTSELIVINNLYINSTQLEYSKAIETRVQARADALLAAKKKAEEMADVLGQAVGKPILIQEDPGYYYGYSLSNTLSYEPGYTSTGTGTTFSEGTINVEAKVKVIFELINK